MPDRNHLSEESLTLVHSSESASIIWGRDRDGGAVTHGSRNFQSAYSLSSHIKSQVI